MNLYNEKYTFQELIEIKLYNKFKIINNKRTKFKTTKIESDNANKCTGMTNH